MQDKEKSLCVRGMGPFTEIADLDCGPYGTCRYHPPVQDCTWPVVLEGHWCGKYVIDNILAGRLRIAFQQWMVEELEDCHPEYPPTGCVNCRFYRAA